VRFIFCTSCLFESDNESPPPRMIGSRMVRSGSNFHQSRSRLAHGQVAHLGRSPSGFWLQASVSPICTTSWSTCARNWFIRSSTAASNSAHVAFGCAFRHRMIPNTSCSPALTCCIWVLRSRLFFWAFMLSSLSPGFSLYITTFLLCTKNETHPAGTLLSGSRGWS
jgi:hypothetical protein